MTNETTEPNDDIEPDETGEYNPSGGIPAHPADPHNDTADDEGNDDDE